MTKSPKDIDIKFLAAVVDADLEQCCKLLNKGANMHTLDDFAMKRAMKNKNIALQTLLEDFYDTEPDIDLWECLGGAEDSYELTFTANHNEFTLKRYLNKKIASLADNCFIYDDIKYDTEQNRMIFVSIDDDGYKQRIKTPIQSVPFALEHYIWGDEFGWGFVQFHLYEKAF